MATSSPCEWIDDFNIRKMSPDAQHMLVDVYRSQVAAQASKMYIEKLIVHPIKITLTFVQTPFPRKRGKSIVSPSFLSPIGNLYLCRCTYIDVCIYICTSTDVRIHMYIYAYNDMNIP
jgi:hypothetical protein